MWVLYLGVVSAGTFRVWPTQMAFVDLQATAFQHGQLHLLLEPSPQLLAQADPYDPKHMKLWVLDLTFYDGHYYTYWGPLPALVLAGVKGVFGIRERVGDQFPSLVALSLLMTFVGLSIAEIARRLFPGLPRWLVALSVVAASLAGPIPHSLASGSIYVTSIASGQAFLWLAVWLVLGALFESRFARARLWGAAVALGLSLACRVSLAPAVALLGLLGAACLAMPEPRWLPAFVRRLVVFALPSSVVLAALLLYNYARFEQWLEFGTTLQLSAWKFRVSSDYVLANLYSYLARPWQLSCEFPFLLQRKAPGLGALPSWVPVPADYTTRSPLVGFSFAVPVVLCLPLLALVVRRWLREVRPRWASWRSDERRNERALVFCVGAAAIAGTVTGAAELGLYLATMRYMLDVCMGLVVLGLLGSWALAQRFQAHGFWPRALANAPCVVLCLATALGGLSLGVQGYQGRYLAKHNPELYQRLARATFACDAPAAADPRR